MQITTSYATFRETAPLSLLQLLKAEIMRGSTERKSENNPECIFITLLSFSSFNLVISGVWEPCRTTSINVWHSGLHHRPHSIEISLYSACMTTIQSVARHECTFWLVSATLKKLSTAPASVSLLPSYAKTFLDTTLPSRCLYHYAVGRCVVIG